MLKFMRDEDAFLREIDKRKPLGNGKDNQDNICVVSILEHHKLGPGCLSGFKQVKLAGGSDNSDLKYLIVMPLGTEDLSDVSLLICLVISIFSLSCLVAAGNKPRQLCWQRQAALSQHCNKCWPSPSVLERLLPRDARRYQAPVI